MIDAKVKVYLVDAFDALVSESNETHHMEKAIDAREQVMAWIDRMIEENASLESENRDLKGEVAELNKEVSDLREEVDELEVTLDDEECGGVETLEAWKHQKAEVTRLRAVLSRIQKAATDIPLAQVYVALGFIREQVRVALSDDAVTNTGEAD